MGNVDTGYAVAAIGFLLGFGFLQGLILVAALLWSGQARGLAGRFMAALIGLISIHLAYRWLGIGAVWSQYPQLSLLPAALVYCWGPLLYLYAYSMSRRRVSRWQFLHFLPSLLIGLLIATTLFYPEQAQQGLAQFIWRREFSDLSSLHGIPGFMRFLLEHYAHGNLFALQFGAYCYLVLGLIRQHKQQLECHFSSLEAIDLNWLRLMTAICLAFLLVYFVFNRWQLHWASESVALWMLNLPFLLLVVGIYIIGFKALYQPSVSADLTTLAAAAEPVKKYQRSSVEPSLADKTSDRLKQVMAQQKLYLDSELTLPQLASAVNLPPHQISQVLNETMQQTFFGFVNSYRIERAKQLLLTPGANLTIVELALEAGFKSKSSFYDAFKKATQMTPTQYRKSAL